MPVLRDFYDVGENCELVFHIHHTTFLHFFQRTQGGRI